MKRGLLFLSMIFLVGHASAQRTVSIPLPHGSEHVSADVYGSGHRGLVLAHGGRFHKESWKPQAQVFAQAGFLVVATSFRGDGFNPDGSPGSMGSNSANGDDVLAAVAYLRRMGAKQIAAIGASMGGDAVAEADSREEHGKFDRIVLLGASGGEATSQLPGRKLFIVARDDMSGSGPRLPEITARYHQASEPKNLILLDGSAHAQFLFQTDQAPRLMRELLRFVSEP